MNNRQKELLRILLVHEEGALQIKDMSEQLDCSEKTVRNDLDKIDDFLQDYESATLIRKPGFGVAIHINETDRSTILQTVFTLEKKSTEERIIEMTFELLTTNKAVTLQHFADRYYVARAAIKKDIETISDWLERFDLQLISKPRLGNIIDGSELKKRTALAHLPELIPSISNEKSYVLDLFLPFEIDTVRKALDKLQDVFSISFTDESEESLLVHALIMVKRTRQKSPIFVQEEEKTKTYERKEYEYTQWFFGQLEDAFRLKFPEEEKIYFTWHLISGKRTEESFVEQLNVENNEGKIIKTIVDKMEKLTLFSFATDTVLIRGLAVHMHSVINRIRYGFPIRNPLLPNIKKMYPYTFSMALLTLEEIKATFSIDIPEDEAAYIVLHFQASIERLEGRRTMKKRALIVCHMGIGMSHLLEAKIEQQYQDIDIVACIGKAELPEYTENETIDFIISTIPLEKVKQTHIVISPLFNQDDKKELNQFLEEWKDKKVENEQQNNLSALLLNDFVFFNVQKEHRYQVVEMLAMRLFEKGYVEKDFVHSAVSRERKSATAIGGRIAIPHGDPSLIKESTIAVAVLKEPHDWGNEQVSIVLMLAISKEHSINIRSVIGQIATLSESPFIVEDLINAKSFDDIVKILNEKQ